MDVNHEVKIDCVNKDSQLPEVLTCIKIEEKLISMV